MKISKILYCFLFWFMVSCSQGEEVPISTQDFKKLYIELQMLQSHYQQQAYTYSSEQDFRHSIDSSRQVIFDFYKTDSSAFRQATEYYASHSDIMKTIAADVKSEIDSLESEIRDN